MKILALLMPLIAAIGALDTGSAEKPAETIRFNADEARRGVAARMPLPPQDVAE